MALPFDYIVITSDEPMGYMYHTQLLFAEYLAKENKVLYINPPTNWQPKNLIVNPTIPKSSGNLTVFNYWNKFPSFIRRFVHANERLNEKRILAAIRTTPSPKVLIWHFDSYRSALNGSGFIKKIQPARIYHVIDPYFRNPIDKELRELADLIIITSPRLVPHYSSHKQKIVNVPQVLNIEAHRRYLDGPLPEKFDVTKPYVALIGTFSRDIDYDWLTTAVVKSSIRLVLIGKVIAETSNLNQFKSLCALKSVEYLGEMTPSQFYPILKQSKAGLIIYNERRRHAIFSPLKALNYLIASIPVISNTDCEIPTLVDESIYITNDLEQFLKTLQAVNQLTFNKEKTNHYLDSVSMENRVEAILHQLTARLNRS